MREMRNYRDYLIERLSDPEKAIVHLQVAVEEYQNDGDMFIVLKALQNVLEAQGDLSELTPQVYLLRGIVYHSRKEYDWAIEDYNTVIALNPDNAEAHTYRALAYNRTGDFDHTHEAFTKVAYKNTKTG